ncbi:anti-sigma factor domain-containing protein [Granulicella cerasi]|uniref:Anti-sigma factor domain-containing protein n=1 Tax=Granulicella cerasi TaxID=741063 RepID=A0ABW1ZCH4_9BACT|nr:anti-sigma factor [Granulicella cerasi]
MAQAAAAQAPLESQEQFDAAAKRFAAQLDTVPVPQAKPRAKGNWLLYGTIAACGLTASTYGVRSYIQHQADRSTMTRSATTITRPTVASSAVVSTEVVPAKNSESENAQLRKQLTDLQQAALAARSAQADLQKQLDADRLQLDQASSDKQALTVQLNAAQGSVQTLHEQLAAAHAASGQQDVQIVALTDKIRSLNAELADLNTNLESKERMLALDKDFLSHDKDIRDLIGSRNLYIADIYDTTEKGKTAKPFGRIFYTQDRSLVFYGFDLDKQPSLSRAVSYQVWGSGSDHDPVSLGLFYQDDGHKRWVLRCNDSKSLSRLNMVFVTVEPSGGSNKPTGKQLLRAYLQIEPNHP